jgi:hypothetical protein
VYAMHPTALQQIVEIYVAIGASSVCFMPYGWSTAVVYNIYNQTQ